MSLSTLPGRVSGVLERFTAGLKEIYGNDLVSVVLYGSAASGEFTDKHSNLNILIVLKDASIQSLAGCRDLIRRSEFHIINPVFMTDDYIKRSLDVFPIEFLDMKDNYRVLSGADPLKDVSVDIKNLRFQCEHELKSRIVILKQAYAKAGRGESETGRILFKSATSAIHILRNALRLKGISAPYDKKDALDLIIREFGLDGAAWRRIIDARSGGVRIDKGEEDGLFAALAADLEKASVLIDRVPVK